MASPRAQAPQLQTSLSALLRRRWEAAAAFVAVILLAVAVVVFMPRSYQSEAKVFVRKGRETVSLDPTATTGQVATLVDSHDREINSVVALMESRFLAQKVVEQIGAVAVLSGTAGQDPGSADKRGGGFSLLSLLPTLDPVTAEDKAIRRIQQNLRVEASRDSNVISIRYVDRTPAGAQVIASAMLQAYKSEHLRVNRTEGSKEFFDEQTALLHTKWQEAAEKLRVLKDEGGFASIDTHRGLLEQRISQVKGQLADTETDLAAAEAKASRLEEIVGSMSENKVSERQDGHPNEARDGMRQQLYALELKERELSSNYGDENPKLIMVRAQLEDARRIVGTQETARVRTTTSINAERESLHLALLQEQAKAAAMRARAGSLGEELAGLTDSMRGLNRLELEVADTQQQVDLASASYRTYAENLEQTRIDQALELNRISNVNTYQQASLESKPVSPRKGLVAAAGLVLAAGAALAVVALREHLDTSLRTPEEVESELDLSVLVTLPNLSYESQLL